MSDVRELFEELERDGEPRGAAEVFAGATRRAIGVRRARRIRRGGAALGAIAALVVVVVLVAQVSTSDHANVDVRETPTTVGPATAAQLAAGHWSSIPAAPIPPRSGASVAWTGNELIVWGGATGESVEGVRADGAAYDPSTRTWRLLPPSPLSARVNAIAVWTGREVVIWGGAHDAVADDHEGAAYDPTSNSWRVIADGAALPPEAFGVWTGSRVVVLGGTEAFAYEPRTDRWEHLPPIPTHVGPPGYEVHSLGARAAASDGHGRVFAFATWDAWKDLGDGKSQGTGGSDLVRYDESTNTWTDLPATRPSGIMQPSEAFWVGGRLLVRGNNHMPGATGPGPEPEVTAWYDPDTGAVSLFNTDYETGLGLGTVPTQSAWTGNALWIWNSSGSTGGPDAPVVPGDATVAAASGHWQRLPRAPFSCGSPSAPVWTGAQVLVYCTTRVQPSQPGPVGGLEYVPG